MTLPLPLVRALQTAAPRRRAAPPRLAVPAARTASITGEGPDRAAVLLRARMAAARAADLQVAAPPLRIPAPRLAALRSAPARLRLASMAAVARARLLARAAAPVAAGHRTRLQRR